ncbi:hypothetical protein [Curtobacterium sp. 1544]|uniref:hypothetical protein n=1 Tax=Curtobacterium sp. 1544 TaxID=3156417 RepID=UPI003391AFCA
MSALLAPVINMTTSAVIATHTPSHVVAGNADINPFDGVKPNSSWLGDNFTTQWKLFLGGLWFLLILFCAFHLLKAVASLRHFKNAKMPQKAEAAKGAVIGTSVMTGAAVIVPAIFGFFLTAVNG